MKQIQSVQKIGEYADNITQKDIDNLGEAEVLVECVNPKCRQFIKYEPGQAEEEDIYRRGHYITRDVKGTRITRNKDGEIKADTVAGVYQAYCSNECGVAHQL